MSLWVPMSVISFYRLVSFVIVAVAGLLREAQNTKCLLDGLVIDRCWLLWPCQQLSSLQKAKQQATPKHTDKGTLQKVVVRKQMLPFTSQPILLCNYI